MDARVPNRTGMQINSVDHGSTGFQSVSDEMLWATKPELMQCINALQLDLETLKLKTRIEPLEWR